METESLLGLLIPVVPFLAFIVIVAFTRKLNMASALISIAGTGITFIFSVIILLKQIANHTEIIFDIPWMYLGSLQLHIGVMINPLTAIMLIVVTLVSLLVQIYSIGYMKGDRSFSKFFAYLSFFTFSMLGIVISNNL